MGEVALDHGQGSEHAAVSIPQSPLLLLRPLRQPPYIRNICGRWDGTLLWAPGCCTVRRSENWLGPPNEAGSDRLLFSPACCLPLGGARGRRRGGLLLLLLKALLPVGRSIRLRPAGWRRQRALRWWLLLLLSPVGRSFDCRRLSLEPPLQ